jgi:hypothetical protein
VQRWTPIQFPKSRFFYFLEYRMMGEVQISSNSVCYTPSSEPFIIYPKLCFPPFSLIPQTVPGNHCKFFSLFITHVSPCSPYLLIDLISRCFLEDLIVKYPKLCSPPEDRYQVSHPYETARRNFIILVSYLYFEI